MSTTYTRAFAEAREDEAFLIYEEADALLTERASAERSWERRWRKC